MYHRRLEDSAGGSDRDGRTTKSVLLCVRVSPGRVTGGGTFEAHRGPELARGVSTTVAGEGRPAPPPARAAGGRRGSSGDGRRRRLRRGAADGPARDSPPEAHGRRGRDDDVAYADADGSSTRRGRSIQDPGSLPRLPPPVHLSRQGPLPFFPRPEFRPGGPAQSPRR